jgi:alpha-L-rhamnosidase
LPERFEHLPDGMLPMCYPADHYNGNFIPNWAMWFVVELEEYAARSNDQAMVDALKPKVLALFDYFKKFENEDGLLEKLEQWVFVEWSEANKFVQDVNYPTNMLYAGTLAAAGRLYAMPELLAKAERIRETIREQSFDGEFFVDNAVYKDGQREVTRNRTEVCQYFAFFFDVASPDTHAALWEKLHREFGPDRSETKAYPEVHPANSFIGNMLRFELLSRYGLGSQITGESVGYLMYMAERTGTLWENVQEVASCNHGFASHICFTLYRDVLGVYRFNPIAKTITLRFNDVGLDWCEGAFPVLDGMIHLRWDKSGDTLRYRLDTPAGYTITVENPTGLVLEPLGE